MFLKKTSFLCKISYGWMDEKTHSTVVLRTGWSSLIANLVGETFCGFSMSSSESVQSEPVTEMSVVTTLFWSKNSRCDLELERKSELMTMASSKDWGELNSTFLIF